MFTASMALPRSRSIAPRSPSLALVASNGRGVFRALVGALDVADQPANVRQFIGMSAPSIVAQRGHKIKGEAPVAPAMVAEAAPVSENVSELMAKVMAKQVTDDMDAICKVRAMYEANWIAFLARRKAAREG
jgi:hypothetical protein